jgi:hypothetical protein
MPDFALTTHNLDYLAAQLHRPPHKRASSSSNVLAHAMPRKQQNRDYIVSGQIVNPLFFLDEFMENYAAEREGRKPRDLTESGAPRAPLNKRPIPTEAFKKAILGHINNSKSTHEIVFNQQYPIGLKEDADGNVVRASLNLSDPELTSTIALLPRVIDPGECEHTNMNSDMLRIRLGKRTPLIVVASILSSLEKAIRQLDHDELNEHIMLNASSADILRDHAQGQPVNINLMPRIAAYHSATFPDNQFYEHAERMLRDKDEQLVRRGVLSERDASRITGTERLHVFTSHDFRDKHLSLLHTFRESHPVQYTPFPQGSRYPKLEELE